jgi:hypothetical protein
MQRDLLQLWSWVLFRGWENTFERGSLKRVDMCAIVSSETVTHLETSTHTETNIDSIKWKWRRSRRRAFPALYDSDYFRITTRFSMQIAANVGQLRNSSMLHFCFCIQFSQTWYSMLCNGSFLLESFKNSPNLREFWITVILRGSSISLS